jgi:DNA-binding NarL/FixJ family response regulator
VSKLRIMLADDHETVREGLKMIVNAQDDMEVVGFAGDGHETVARAQELLPGRARDGYLHVQTERAESDRETHKGLPASESADPLAPHGRRLRPRTARGRACAYVLKQSAPSELIHAMRAVATGGKYIDPKLTANLVDSYSDRASRSEAKGILSDRESEVLRLIALGYSNKEIGASLSLSVKTIEVHKANAMRKLNITSRINHVRYAIFQIWLHDH